jgi:hypothetical protein
MKRPSKEEVEREIEALDTLDTSALRSSWQKLYRSPAPKTFRRALLIRALAYQIQAKAFGGLAPKTQKLLLKYAANAEQGTFTTAGTRRRLRPGTRLIRAYDGKTHTVEVLADAFAWNGQKFRSLSAIAKAISGTNWNGHVFFGLLRPAKASSAATSEAIDG